MALATASDFFQVGDDFSEVVREHGQFVRARGQVLFERRVDLRLLLELLAGRVQILALQGDAVVQFLLFLGVFALLGHERDAETETDQNQKNDGNFGLHASPKVHFGKTFGKRCLLDRLAMPMVG